MDEKKSSAHIIQTETFTSKPNLESEDSGIASILASF